MIVFSALPLDKLRLKRRSPNSYRRLGCATLKFLAEARRRCYYKFTSISIAIVTLRLRSEVLLTLLKLRSHPFSPTLLFSYSPILLFSYSPSLLFSYSPSLLFSYSPYSYSPTLLLSYSPILLLSHLPIYGVVKSNTVDAFINTGNFDHVSIPFLERTTI
jgi:hypothetical protein